MRFLSMCRKKNKQIIRNETHHAVEAAAARLWQLGGSATSSAVAMCWEAR